MDKGFEADTLSDIFIVFIKSDNGDYVVKEARMVYLIYDPVKARQLRPGDLFSVEPGSATAAPGLPHKVIFPDGAVGFGQLAVRTDAPCPSADAEVIVYRVTIEGRP